MLQNYDFSNRLQIAVAGIFSLTLSSQNHKVILLFPKSVLTVDSSGTVWGEKCPT